MTLHLYNPPGVNPRLPTPPAPSRRAKIIEMICRECGVNMMQIRGEQRTRHIAQTRALMAECMRSWTPLSTTAIGRVMSKDHSTICTASRKSAEFAAKDAQFASIRKLVITSLEQLYGERQDW